jgi:hypothetical protein
MLIFTNCIGILIWTTGKTTDFVFPHTFPWLKNHDFYMVFLLNTMVYAAWLPTEAFVLSRWGTTFGKWLLRIELKFPGGRASFAAALKRSAQVWLRGHWMGIVPLTYIAHWLAYRTLRKKGETPWDRAGKISVSHGMIGFVRGFCAAVLIGGVFVGHWLL